MRLSAYQYGPGEDAETRLSESTRLVDEEVSPVASDEGSNDNWDDPITEIDSDSEESCPRSRLPKIQCETATGCVTIIVGAMCCCIYCFPCAAKLKGAMIFISPSHNICIDNLNEIAALRGVPPFICVDGPQLDCIPTGNHRAAFFNKEKKVNSIFTMDETPARSGPALQAM